MCLEVQFPNAQYIKTKYYLYNYNLGRVNVCNYYSWKLITSMTDRVEPLHIIYNIVNSWLQTKTNAFNVLKLSLLREVKKIIIISQLIYNNIN